MFIHPTVLRHLFVIKAVYTTIALFGVLGWAISANGGSIGDFKYTTTQRQLSGTDLIWPMVQASEQHRYYNLPEKVPANNSSSQFRHGRTCSRSH
jgi:cytosine/uracil/thiamine/allantoin permease